MGDKIALVWLRRDLRVNDNRALEAAYVSGLRVVPVFIFDPGILELLPDREDRRVEFIVRSLRGVERGLGQIHCFYGRPADVFEWLLEGGLEGKKVDRQEDKQEDNNLNRPAALFYNEDYEPGAVKRDNDIEALFEKRGVPVYRFTDQVIFSPDDSRIRKPDGTPYTIYTPFSKRWRLAYGGGAAGNGGRAVTALLAPAREPGPPATPVTAKLLLDSPTLKLFGSTPTPEQIGFKTIQNLGFVDDPGELLLKTEETISSYHKTRDIPALDTGTTKIGIHLRFGTISIREAVAIGAKLNDTWLGELIWREFFMHIIKNFPYSEDAPFKKQYNFIPWRNDQREIEAWMRGETGYPLVDAGMRELNETGHMHNRVRMVVASFLTKHLLTDWRIGEAYFAAKLNDYELSSNVGNWQWAAGTGCDAAPYFRIFNPKEQASKFDPHGDYIRRWVPEAFEAEKAITGASITLSKSYPLPIVEHRFARERALAAYTSSK